MKILKVFLSILIISMLISSVLATLSLFEYWNNYIDNVAYLYDVYWESQTFTVGSIQHSITSVKINASAYPAPYPPTTNVFLIETVDTNNKPSGNILVSKTVDTSGWSGVKQLHEITFDSSPTLSANTIYALVIHGPSGLHILTWWCTNYDLYSGGNRCYSTNSGVDWTTSIIRDFGFEIWGYAKEYTFNGLMSLNQTVCFSKSVSVSKSGIEIINIAQSDTKQFSFSKFGQIVEQFGLSSDSGKFYMLGGGGGITTINFPISADFVVLILTIIGCIFLCFIKIPLVAFIIAPFTISFSAYATTDINMPFYPNPIFCIFGAVIGIICFLINANFVYETGQKKYKKRKR